MRVLFVSAEADPFSKVGGLADVAAALPAALAAMGHDVRVITPCHASAMDVFRAADDRQFLQVPDFAGMRTVELATVPGHGGVPVTLVHQPHYFGRPGVYGDPDDLLRYRFFCRVVGTALREKAWIPEILHLNDWHTAPLAFALRNFAWSHPALRGTASVLTIHNLRYRGPDDFNDYLAQGIYYSDFVTTVSPAYAREILSPESGEGLDRLLRLRGDSLVGILNGLSFAAYDPATDTRIAARFGARTIDKRASNTGALRAAAGLEPAAGPLLGMVTRLTEQKGIDLVIEAAPAMIARGAELVVLGQGDDALATALRALEATYPGRVRLVDDFDEGLARRIYAGSDMFLMPSRFEPCGLGQLIAMRYGSIPIGRRTGGLADTIVDPQENAENATGFLFDDFAPGALLAAFERARAAFDDLPLWRQLQANGMQADMSWGPSAKRYVEVYERALRQRGA
ncbi:MAG: glycogen synthase [Dehalococcoidia bacterium]|nr:glycogen synthase [Dehalococcoidia bacterium]